MRTARFWGWSLAVGCWLALPARVLAAPAGQEEAGGLSSYLPVIIVAVVLLVIVGRQIFARPGSSLPPSEPGSIRDYGPAGGAVCRGCGRPFARGVLDLNLLTGKLERCPHCGKWAVLPAASRVELAAAEERERLLAGQAPAAGLSHPTEEELMRRRIEESKYE